MRYRTNVVLLAAIVIGALPIHIFAQSETLCFDVPTITDCISGRILEYWRINGGGEGIGYPLTSLQLERNPDTGLMYPTQWFERSRLEVHSENKPPYDILMGRLGDERLQVLRRHWQAEGRESGPIEGCIWFVETGHNVCNQGSFRDGTPDGFRSIWEIGGLWPNCGLLHGVDRGSCTKVALAFLGLPLTRGNYETIGDGDYVYTQWFERARLEWHPLGGVEGLVMFGRLGAEMWISNHD